MKSSLRPTPDSSGPAVLPIWSPAEFHAAHTDLPADSADAVLAILGAAGTGLVNAAAAVLPPRPAQASEWAPADLGQIGVPVKPAWRVIANPLTSTEKISPEREINHLRQQVLDQANARAAEIVREAEEKAAEILAQAQQGSDEVTLQAHQEGWTSAEAETSEMLRTIQEIVRQTEAWRAELMAQSETAVLELVREIARVMFGDGFELNQKELQNTFNKVLADARALGDLRIYVNPEDAANLDPYWREFQVSVSGHQIQIIPSETIHRGGCFIDGQWGSIDARVETQLKTILDTLVENSPNPAPEIEGSAD